MDYLSKGVKRLLVVVVVLLVALAVPVFGANAWGRFLVGLGVPMDWQVYAVVGLLALAFGLSVGWVFHVVQRALLSKRRGA